jgi:hypothetical protein
MREIIDRVDRGDLRPHVNHAASNLAAELEHRVRDLVVDFIKEHESQMEQSTVCQALLGAAAVQVMLLFEMGPDDFAELARATARLSIPEVEALRARIDRTGIA